MKTTLSISALPAAMLHGQVQGHHGGILKDGLQDREAGEPR